MEGSFWGSMLTDISDFISFVFAAMTDEVLPAILGNPILFLFVVAVPLVGIAIGIFNRVKAA